MSVCLLQGRGQCVVQTVASLIASLPKPTVILVGGMSTEFHPNISSHASRRESLFWPEDAADPERPILTWSKARRELL